MATLFSRVFVSELEKPLQVQHSISEQVWPMQPSRRSTDGAGPAELGCTRGTEWGKWKGEKGNIGKNPHATSWAAPAGASQVRRCRAGGSIRPTHVPGDTSSFPLTHVWCLQTTRQRLRAPRAALQNGRVLLITAAANCTREQDPPRAEMTPRLLFILKPSSSVQAALHQLLQTWWHHRHAPKSSGTEYLQALIFPSTLSSLVNPGPS